MLITEIFLIIISGLGVLHGIFLAIYLCGYAKVRTLSNIILSLLLFVLSFRVGKSVILEYADGVDHVLIFTGLASLLLIGPLFYLYSWSVLNTSFRITKATLFHFIPFIPAVAFGLMVTPGLVRETPIAMFVLMFCLYYGHYLFYMLLSYRKIIKASKLEGNVTTIRWLKLLCYGLTAIWVVYILNLLENEVPYIIGPVLYSFIAYGITFLAIKNGYINRVTTQPKYQTTALKQTEAVQLYGEIKKLVAEQGLFKDPALSLNSLSKSLSVSPQKISMAINLHSQSNFNGFINHFRIMHAQTLLNEKEYQNYTIAFVAFETGFTSLSTFNTAFKKETGKTPSAYRKQMAEKLLM